MDEYKILDLIEKIEKHRRYIPVIKEMTDGELKKLYSEYISECGQINMMDIINGEEVCHPLDVELKYAYENDLYLIEKKNGKPTLQVTYPTDENYVDFSTWGSEPGNEQKYLWLKAAFNSKGEFYVEDRHSDALYVEREGVLENQDEKGCLEQTLAYLARQKAQLIAREKQVKGLWQEYQIQEDKRMR